MPEPETTMTGPQRVLWSVVLIAITIALVLGANYLLRTVERNSCPGGTFLYGPLHPDAALQFIAISLFAFVTFGVFAFTKNRQPIKAGFRIPPQSQAWAARVAFLVGLALLACALWADLCQYCLLPQTIAYRAQPWEAMHHADWSAVRAIQTSCWHQQKGGWDDSYLLVLAEGTMIDIVAAPDFRRNYPILARQLHNRAIPFNARGVSPYCKSPLLPLLTTAP